MVIDVSRLPGCGRDNEVKRMSLFENEQYRWRETYFVLFQAKNRPPADKIRQAFEELGTRLQVSEVHCNAEGQFESLMLLSPDDFSAMDITYVAGEDAAEQLEELTRDVFVDQLTAEEKKKWDRLPDCDARFDVYHFEQVDNLADEEDSMLDPGALLIVLQTLSGLCDGVGVDPQSGTLV